MKHLVLTSLLLLAGCGASFADITKDAPAQADQAVAKLEAAVQFIRQDIVPYAQTGIAICKALGPDSKVCADIDKAANLLVEALDQADQAVADYKVGKVEAAKAYELVKSAIKVAEDYARAVLSAHANLTLNGGNVGGSGGSGGSGGAGGSGGSDADAGV